MKIFVLLVFFVNLLVCGVYEEYASSGEGFQFSSCQGACLIRNACVQNNPNTCLFLNGTFQGFDSSTCNQTCFQNQTFVNGFCVYTCNLCFQNQTCISDVCINNCRLCQPYQLCSNGHCVSSCGLCYSNQTCVNGSCISSCSLCNANQTCVRNDCLYNYSPYLSIIQTCINGTCFIDVVKLYPFALSPFALLILSVALFCCLFNPSKVKREKKTKTYEFKQFENVIDIDDIDDLDFNDSKNSRLLYRFNKTQEISPVKNRIISRFNY